MIKLSNKKHWLEDQAKRYPENAAIMTSEKSLSFKELNEECLLTAQYFKNHGIRKRNHVGILTTHNHYFCVVINALWFIGAIPIPLNIKNAPGEIHTQLERGKIKFLLIDETLNSQYSIINFKNKIKIPDSTKSKIQKSKARIHNSKFVIHNSALMMFTSGSSGKPKLVVHTFKSLYESVKAADPFFNFSSKNIWLSSLPLYHIGGFMILCRSLITGSVVAFPNSLNQKDVLTGIKSFKPTHISFVPTILLRLLKTKIKPWPNLKYIFLGGGPSESNLCIDAVSKGWPVVKVYGSTETCSMVTALLPSEIKKYSSSSGKPLGKNKIKIMSKSNNDVVGEILIKSKSLFKKYYNGRLQISNKLKNNWYYSGDYGKLDNKGYLFVNSRREDLIISGGENVNVHEIESVIRSYKKVKDAIVFGLEDKAWGQMVCAAIAADKLNEEELKRFLKQKIASYKIPKQIYFVKSIPRNEIGKLKRNELFKLLSLN
jgi:o-succinylbenzoate---CoA ligase